VSAPAILANDQVARAYLARLEHARDGLPPIWHFVLKVGEEASEAMTAWHRSTGLCRGRDNLGHVAEELADTVISAYALAQMLGLDLDGAIQAKHHVLMTRDLREPVTAVIDGEQV
jgi:NTP pyrophosphatase (non-canonical NTP hydrolase)